MPSSQRREFLRAAATGAVVATAGCLDALPFQSHVHHEDAPVGEYGHPWPTLGADPARTGARPDATPPSADATLLEATIVGQFADAQPAIVGSVAYLGVDRRDTDEREGEFSGLLAVEVGDGTVGSDAVAWRQAEGGGGRAHTPTVRGNVVFSPVGDGVAAFDASDGEPYWRNRDGGIAPAVAGEDCYTGVSETALALDAVTGETRWTFDGLVAAPSGFAVADDAVCLACGDGGEGALYAFERDDGTVRWRYDDVGESYAAAVTDGERAYAVGTDGTLHAVSLSDGERAWHRSMGDPSYARPAVTGGTVYVAGTNSERVAALDAESGEPRWARRLGVGALSPPAVAAGTLLLTGATSDGHRLFALDAADGRQRWQVATPSPPIRSVQPVVADGRVFVVASPDERVQDALYVLS